MFLTLAQVGALFTAPWLAAAGAAAVTVPVAIHLLSRFRRHHERWGAMRFLMLAYRRHKRRLHMEQWLLLLVRCLLVFLLGLALAGPLMGGFVGDLAGGLDRRGRVVHLLISDSLSSRTQTSTDEEQPRFAALRNKALALVDGLKPNDRVALWRTARPAEALVASPTLEHDRVRRRIEQMQPRFSRPDLPRALAGVAERLNQQQVSPDRGRVFVLSDFARAGDYLRRSAAQAARRLADHAEVRITRPSPAAANAQVQVLTPRRRLVLAPAGEAASVPVAATLRRFNAAAAHSQHQLNLTLTNLAGEIVATGQSPVPWRRGQATAGVNLTLTSEPGAAAGGEGGQTWLLRAELAGNPAANRLPADDTAWARVTVRSHLNVGLIGAGPSAGENDRLAPDQWLGLALSPQGPAEAGAMRPRQVEPGAVGGSDQPLEELDAAMVVRPDRLNEAGWAALAEFARAGGLVWVFTPPTPGAAGWIEPMQQAFALDWGLAMSPRQPAGPSPRQLNPDHPAPEALSRLAADWGPLVQPVRLSRWLPIEAPAPQTWLALKPASQQGEPAEQSNAQPNGQPFPAEAGGPGGDQASGSALLASRAIGAGRLMLLGTALSSEWTNLPTKPVMVPLVQESLRSAVGPDPAAIVAGDRPTLAPRWAGVARLVRLNLTEGEAAGDPNHTANTPSASLALQTGEGGPRPAEPFRRPGPYRAAEAGHALAVNADPAAGDTRATSRRRLSGWFDQLVGPANWRMLPENDPAAVLARTTARASLGWPLLWVVLALAVIELLLARHFAHAQRTDQLPLRARLLGLWHRLRYRA